MDAVARLIQLALDEDLGGPGDLTTAGCLRGTPHGKAQLLCKQEGVIAGIEVFRHVFEAVSPEVRVSFLVKEGARVQKGQIVAEVTGPLAAILTGERTALNFLQRLSGIATTTARAVSMLAGTKCRILDTRKTTPGWRGLEKAAVRAGGGRNHRFGLFDGILIKDNHIAAVGSITEAVRRVRESIHHLIKVEVEVVDLEGVREALHAGAEVLLLDNMSIAQLAEAVAVVRARAQTEASGGIRLENLTDVARTGVDFISMGMLTHSAGSIDLSLEVLAANA